MGCLEDRCTALTYLLVPLTSTFPRTAQPQSFLGAQKLTVYPTMSVLSPEWYQDEDQRTSL